MGSLSFTSTSLSKRYSDPIDTQVKLLRVLQEGEFERVGSSETIKVDVRVIAATNRDPKEIVANGTFRSDLFYRLNVFPLEVPPLRDRKEDIPLLVNFFLSKFGKKLGKELHGVSQKAMENLTNLQLARKCAGNAKRRRAGRDSNERPDRARR